MRQRLLALLLLLTLLCAACTPRPPQPTAPGEGEYALYFVFEPDAGEDDPGRADGAVLEKEYRALDSEAPDAEKVPLLMEALLEDGPRSPDLRSPFPQGITLRSWELDGEGVLRLDLSEGYGGLSGVGLTLADGCIVLTLSQLPGVEEVYLTVEGRPRPFRDQVLTPDQFLLDNTLKGELTPPAETGESLPTGEPSPSPDESSLPD